jgi:hypothetical protein
MKQHLRERVTGRCGRGTPDPTGVVIPSEGGEAAEVEGSA